MAFRAHPACVPRDAPGGGRGPAGRASARLRQGCFWRQHVGCYFLTYSTKTKTIFSSASCRASQLATENYTSCQSPLFWLEEKERPRDRGGEEGGREREKVLLEGAGYQPCHPSLAGRLTRRAAFSRDSRMSAFRKLSWVASWFQKNPALVGAGTSLIHTQRLQPGRKSCWLLGTGPATHRAQTCWGRWGSQGWAGAQWLPSPF